MFVYRPVAARASGYAIVSARFAGLVSADVKPQVVAELYRLLEAPETTTADVLEIFDDPATAERFALIEVLDAAAELFHLAVRGEVQADVSGAIDGVAGAGGTSWVTGRIHAPDALRLSFDPAPVDGPEFPLRDGIVAAGELALERVAASPAPEAPVADGVPVASRPSRTPIPVDLGIAVQGQVWTLALPDGDVVEATAQLVVGRRPWRSDPFETSTTYVLARSPHREISGKHLELAVVDGELQARDLDSTNGTLVITADRPPRLLHGGRATSLQTGDTLDLGEGFRIVVGTR